MESRLLFAINGLDICSFDEEEGEHLKVAVVGSMVKSCLTGAITNVQVTKMRDEYLCHGQRDWGGGGGGGWERERERDVM